MEKTHPRPYGRLLRWSFLLAAIGLLWPHLTARVLAPTSTPAAVLSESGHPYKFLSANAKGPATWPCATPIDVAVNLAALDSASRRSFLADLSASLRSLEQNSHYTFRLLGETSAVPTKSWGFDWVKYTPRAQVVVAVIPFQASDLATEHGAAIGGSYFNPDTDGRLRSFAGYVVIQSERFFDYVPGSGHMSHQALITHEMLHVLNLDHVDDPASLLTERLSHSDGHLGPGDLAGLEALYASSCSN